MVLMADKQKIIKLLIMQYAHKSIPEKVYKKLDSSLQNIIVNKQGKYYVKQNYRKKVKVVLTGGVFDILHKGHLYTLKKAKSYGDMLVVAVAKDKFVEKAKGIKPLHDQKTRCAKVNKIKEVDVAVPGMTNRTRFVEIIKPDLIVYGYDQYPYQYPFVSGLNYVKLRTSFKEKTYKSSILRRKEEKKKKN